MKFSSRKGLADTDVGVKTWNNGNPYLKSLPVNERRAFCLNSAEWYKLNGTEYNIEEQRARFLAESHIRRKSFLKKHNHSSAPQTQLHYQTLPQFEHVSSTRFGRYNNQGHLKEAYPFPTQGPSTTPVSHTEDKKSTHSIYDHLNDRNFQLDGAIRELTEVALDHIKRDNAKMSRKNSTQGSKSCLECEEQGTPRPVSKVIDVTLSLPFQKTKSLPQNIMKLVQSSSDLPETRFRYQKTSQPYPLVSSRPSGYQIAYHKAKEDFKIRHNNSNDTVGQKKKSSMKPPNSASSESSTSSTYGNFGSSSDFGRLKSKNKKKQKRKSNLGEGDHTLPQISSGTKAGKAGAQVREEWHQIYEQWSRTDSRSRKDMSRPHTSSFPLLNDVNRHNFKN